MKLIKPKVEIISQENGLFGIYKQIELAGRTCYKSEDKITGTSCKEFVSRMIKSGHTAMLEHGSVYLTIPMDIWQEDLHEFKFMFPEGCSWIDINSDGSNIYISTNYRHIIEGSVGEETLKEFISSPSEMHEKRITVRFTCDRGVSHELVRHRVFSFAQESTRYCNYSKDKFGNELTYIIPSWIDLTEGEANALLPLARAGAKLTKEGERDYTFFRTLEIDENVYFALLEDGCKPQEARQALPNALKTEVVMTGFVKDWEHFFELRCAPNAHPDMQVLAKDLKQQFTNNGIL